MSAAELASIRDEARLKRMHKAAERMRLRAIAVEMHAELYDRPAIAERLRVSVSTVTDLLTEHRRRHL